MNQTSIIDVQHRQFSNYWGRLSAEHQSPYKINAAFAELHHGFVVAQSGAGPAETASNDFSFVVVRGERPLIGCCLILQEQANAGRTLGCRGIFATSEFDSSCLNAESNNVESDVFACLNDYLERLIDELAPDMVEFYDPMRCGVMSPVSHWLLSKGAMPVLCSGQLLDLRVSQQQIMAGLNERQQEAIAWGRKNLVFRLLDSSDELDSSQQGLSTMNSGHGLSAPSSNAYYRSLLDAQKAFIIQAFADRTLIASTTFSLSSDTAYYIASIAQTDSSSSPVLLSLIWEGVQHARTLGLSWAELISAESDALGADRSMSGFGGIEQTRFKLLLTLS